MLIETSLFGNLAVISFGFLEGQITSQFQFGDIGL
jgi:hypothetical protein